MAFSNTQTISGQPNITGSRTETVEDDPTLRRLEALLAENAATLRSQRLFSTERERFEAGLMRHPMNTDRAFSYFGLLLGTLPPATMFMRFLIDSRGLPPDGAWIVGILLIVNTVTSIVGYFSGKLIAKMVTSVETYRWPVMMALLPLIGLLWGIMAGGAGGFVNFGIGAFFGVGLGGIVGAGAFPLFVGLHPAV